MPNSTAVTLAGAVSAIGAFCWAWQKGAFAAFLPSPTDVACNIKEVVIDVASALKPRRGGNKFLVLISRLDADDAHNTHTRAVIRAFQGRNDVDRIATCRALRLTGAGIESEARSLTVGRRWLRRRAADLLIWGEVLEPGKAINLWFLSNDAASPFEASPFRLESNLLTDEFQSVAKEKLIATALSAVAPANALSGKFLAAALRPILDRLKHLLNNSSGYTDLDRARLLDAIGLASLAVGRQSGSRLDVGDAVSSFSNALGCINRHRVPRLWATVQHHLGNALMALADHEAGTASTHRAIEAYEAALVERTRDHSPREWANTENAMGTAFLRLGLAARNASEIRRALELFQLAASVLARELTPLDWCVTQGNAARALFVLANIDEETANAEEAARIAKEAIEACSRRDAPRLWAFLHTTLGLALGEVGRRNSSAELTEKALEQLFLAHEECTRERAPTEWATIQGYRGEFLLRLGEFQSDLQKVEEAVEAFRLALEELTKDRMPLGWATAQYNLAVTLTKLAMETIGPPPIRFIEISGDPSRLAAEPGPIDWKISQQDLSAVIVKLELREKAIGWLDEAIEVLSVLLNEFKRDEFPHVWAATQNALCGALRVRGEHDQGIEYLIRAVSAGDAALQIWTREKEPLKWASARYDRAVAVLKLGERELGTEMLATAVGEFRSLLASSQEEDPPLQRANVRSALADALLLVGERERDAKSLQECASRYSEAITLYREVGAKRRAELAENGKKKAETLLQSMRE